MPVTRDLDRIEIVAFPVPGQQARLLRVVRDPNSAGYEELPEGTDLTDCTFLAARDLDPYDTDTYKLSKINVDQQTGRHQWFFLNVRANENAYNFETKYLDEASTKPILTRTYVVPRSTYAPVAEGTADPVVSALKLISQEQARVDDPIVDSLFVAVTRTYVELPGVIMGGGRFGEGRALPYSFQADLEIETTEQKVLPGTAPDKGAGVVESVVTPESVNLSVKKTESLKTGQLPKTQTGAEVVGEYGGQVATRTEVLKTSGSLEATMDFRTTRLRVEPQGNGRFIEERVHANAAWPELEGNEYDEVLGIDIPFTERVVDATDPLFDVAGKEVRPIDQWRSQIKVLDNVATQAALDAFKASYTTQERVSLPDRLVSVTVHWEGTAGEGASQLYTGWPNNITLRASGSGVIGGAASYEIEQGYSGSVPATIYIMFLPLSALLPGSIATAINTKWNYTGDAQVKPWPIIRPKGHNVIVRGRSGSLEVGWRYVSGSPILKETDRRFGRTLTVTRIPPTIHGAITVGTDGDNTVTVNVKRIVESADPVTDATQELVGAVTPTSLPATTPASFPVGKYLLTSEAAPFRAGYARVTAVVVDITSDYV
jgi:hypothetical protein